MTFVVKYALCCTEKVHAIYEGQLCGEMSSTSKSQPSLCKGRLTFFTCDRVGTPLNGVQKRRTELVQKQKVAFSQKQARGIY